MIEKHPTGILTIENAKGTSYSIELKTPTKTMKRPEILPCPIDSLSCIFDSIIRSLEKPDSIVEMIKN